jgi:hypothetical protein
MRTKILACCAVLGVAWAVSCSTSSDGTNDNGGDSGGSDGGGSGGKASGGSGGSASGGSGGSANGGSGSGGSSGSGGAANGGSGGEAGAGGTAMGGAGGKKASCAVVPAAKKVDFESDADLWIASSDVTKADNLRVPAPMPTLSAVQKHGDAGKSMELIVNTADGLPTASADAGADAGTDAGAAGGVTRTQWFFMFPAGIDFAKYMQAGRTISVWVLLPTGHKVARLAFGALSSAGWNFNEGGVTTAVPGTWTKLSYTFKEDYDCSKVMYWNEVGLYMEIPMGQTWSGKIYVDDFEFGAKP